MNRSIYRVRKYTNLLGGYYRLQVRTTYVGRLNGAH